MSGQEPCIARTMTSILQAPTGAGGNRSERRACGRRHLGRVDLGSGLRGPGQQGALAEASSPGCGPGHQRAPATESASPKAKLFQEGGSRELPGGRMPIRPVKAEHGLGPRWAHGASVQNPAQTRAYGRKEGRKGTWVCKYLFETRLSVLLGASPGVGLLDWTDDPPRGRLDSLQ
ncbi:uncharacterized protein LOC118521210 isoform X1 [Halichoerus grypus]